MISLGKDTIARASNHLQDLRQDLLVEGGRVMGKFVMEMSVFGMEMERLLISAVETFMILNVDEETETLYVWLNMALLLLPMKRSRSSQWGLGDNTSSPEASML